MLTVSIQYLHIVILVLRQEADVISAPVAFVSEISSS